MSRLEPPTSLPASLGQEILSKISDFEARLEKRVVLGRFARGELQHSPSTAHLRPSAGYPRASKGSRHGHVSRLSVDEANWDALDAARQMEEVGRLLRWGRADAGRGVVWVNWSCAE